MRCRPTCREAVFLEAHVSKWHPLYRPLQPRPQDATTAAVVPAPMLAPFNSEDMLLPGAHRKPPSPEPLGSNVATPGALAGARRCSTSNQHIM